MAEQGTRCGLLPCFGAALCSALIPGVGHAVTHARFRRPVVAATVLNAIASVVVIVILAPTRSRADLADTIADRTVFIGLAVALLVLAITRLWAIVDVAWQTRPPAGTALQTVAGLTAGMVLIAGVAPLAMAANYVWQTDRALERVFGSGEAITANPSPLTTTTDMAGSTTTSVATHVTSVPASTSTTADSTTTSTTPPPAERVNVLLLGGDAGPGRWSLRTDSMVVISIDPGTGDTAMISIPRNLRRLPFPPGTPLAKKYPKGFDDLANAVWTRVNAHRELAGGGEDAGAQAIKLGIAQLLGIPIHYYVLVDMSGFVAVVDALGGIDINVTKRVPAADSPPDAKHKSPAWFEVGLQHMDGTLALAYSRSRRVDSDYSRMARQRCVLGAIAASATPWAIASGLTDLLAAVGDAVRTDIPRERLGELAQWFDAFSANGGLHAVRTLHLAPPLVDPADWDAAEVRGLVATVLTPGAPAVGTGISVLTEGC